MTVTYDSFCQYNYYQTKCSSEATEYQTALCGVPDILLILHSKKRMLGNFSGLAFYNGFLKRSVIHKSTGISHRNIKFPQKNI